MISRIGVDQLNFSKHNIHRFIDVSLTISG